MTIPDNSPVFIDDFEQKFLAQKISAMFKNFNLKRLTQLNDLETLRDAIYQNHLPHKNSWCNKIKLPDLYETAQTLKSHLLESIYSNPEAMFDVSGRSPEAQQFANSHKSMLISAFEDMKFSFELEKIVDNLVEAGEATLFVGWNTRYKQVRRPKSPENLLSEPDNTDFYSVQDVCVFDGPTVSAVPPENFVFDIDRKNSWDSCAKIFRNFATVDEIAEAYQNNFVTSQVLADLEVLASSKNSKSSFSNDYSVSSLTKQLEILEFWGDIKLSNGTLLKNYLITVASGEKILRFEPNPFVINPFIHATIIENPATKRGISPLKVALSLSDLSSTILNKQLDALSLLINPPYLAPKGCFKGEQEVKPGKIIEYDSALMPHQPVPLKFDSALRGWDFISFFKSQIENATGIFKNMAGQINPKNRTATELTYTMNSQGVRLNMFVEAVSKKLIIPMVEKVAEIIAGFRFGEEKFIASHNGKNILITVNDKSRNARYIYRYGDRKAGLDRKSRFKELFEVILSFSKFPKVAQSIDWIECFKFALEQFGVENADNFLSVTPDLIEN